MTDAMCRFGSDCCSVMFLQRPQGLSRTKSPHWHLRQYGAKGHLGNPCIHGSTRQDTQGWCFWRRWIWFRLRKWPWRGIDGVLPPNVPAQSRSLCPLIQLTRFSGVAAVDCGVETTKRPFSQSCRAFFRYEPLLFSALNLPYCTSLYINLVWHGTAGVGSCSHAHRRCSSDQRNTAKQLNDLVVEYLVPIIVNVPGPSGCFCDCGIHSLLENGIGSRTRLVYHDGSIPDQGVWMLAQKPGREHSALQTSVKFRLKPFFVISRSFTSI